MASQAMGNEPVIVAHRGASGDAPENTIPAFKLAWEQGADAIEGDFHLTKDGQIVCIHDKDTKKVSGQKLMVRDTTLESLKKLDVGAYRGQQFAGTRIPTIAEVFAIIPAKKKIYIEVKCGPEIIPALIQEIGRSGLANSQVVVISFNKAVIKDFKLKSPKHKAYWLAGTKKEKDRPIAPSPRSVSETLKQIGADGFSSNKNHIDESYVHTIKGLGHEYHVWTVNDVKAAELFKEWGAGSITTDYPGRIRKHLQGAQAPAAK